MDPSYVIEVLEGFKYMVRQTDDYKGYVLGDEADDAEVTEALQFAIDCVHRQSESGKERIDESDKGACLSSGEKQRVVYTTTLPECCL